CRTVGRRHSAIAYQAALFGTPRLSDGRFSFQSRWRVDFPAAVSKARELGSQEKMNETINAAPAVWKKIDSFGGNSTSPALTAWRPCPVCGALECRTLMTFDDFQFYGDSADLPKRAQVQQVQCLICQAIFMNPGYSETGQRVLFAAAGNSFRSRPEHQTAQVTWLEQRGLAAPAQTCRGVGAE